MKKIGIILSFLLFFIPSVVWASDVSYDIKHYYIDANILENGDLEVSELLVLKGTFNGYVRDITYKNSALTGSDYGNNSIYNASDITLKGIYAKKVSSVSFETINDNDYIMLWSGQASNGGYIKSNISNGYSYKMYFRANNETVAFKIVYTVQDVAVLHKDVAELYWTFVGDGFTDSLSDVIVRVNLPSTDTSDNFRVWAHGDLTGEINKINDSYAEAKISKLDAYSSVDIRLTFSPTLLDQDSVLKTTNTEALDDIVSVEEKRAEQANLERMRIRNLYYGTSIISILYIIILVMVWIYVYKKYDKEFKSPFTNQYNREFIDDYNVEVVDYLMNKKITPNAMSASILNLIYKKVIKVEEIPTDKKKKEYKFTKLNEDGINETEKTLLDFLFNKIGKDNTFTTKELQNYAKSAKTCEEFNSGYKSWERQVLKDAEAQEFFLKNGKAKGIGSLFLVIGLLLIIITGMLSIVNPLVYICLILGIIFFVYTMVFTKKSEKGVLHYSKWKAFKNFLKDFGKFDIKELPEITLWERYMVYATVFGLSLQVAKVMNVKIKELEQSGVYVGGYNPIFRDIYIYNTLNTNFSGAIRDNHQAITAARANSTSSSGSGFGGGFSSGGGFGGGGGGGHGF